MSLRPLRLFEETNASEDKMVLTMMSFLFRGFYAAFDLGAYAIVT